MILIARKPILQAQFNEIVNALLALVKRADGITRPQWRWLRENWQAAYERHPGRVLGATVVWSEAALEASLQEALAAPHRQPDVWLFAYGSLIWNPVLEFDERVVATAHGWHRSFCLSSRVNRGTPERPGLVLGLDRGGRCTGVAYRIPERIAEQVLRLLWRREMLLGSYAPRWVLVTHGARSLRALAFVVQRDRSGYAGRLPAETIVERLVHARGAIGTWIDYLRQTIDGLAAIGIRDPNLMHLDGLIRARLGEDEPHGPRADLQL